MNNTLEIEIYLKDAVFMETNILEIQSSVKDYVAKAEIPCNERHNYPALPDFVESIKLCCDHCKMGQTKQCATFNAESVAFYPLYLIENSSNEVINEDDFQKNEAEIIVTPTVERIVELECLLKDYTSINVTSLTVNQCVRNDFEFKKDGDDQNLTSATWMIPCPEFDGLWETLYFSDQIKKYLLSYALTSLDLTTKGVDPNIVCCNRLVILHGPPGTGKTTLCKALAHKMSIRMQNIFPYALFVEVNCHSLFSKWFSESGKLVSKMFSKIREYASESKTLVIVLIDEVESLTSARQASINSGEPSDAIRVVNAVLTQLDLLRFHSNVFVFATSNLTENIDPAFADRADIIQYIGLPGSEEIFEIFKSCIKELERIGILPSHEIPKDCILPVLARHSEGLSGRVIRKLPLMALSEWHRKVGNASGKIEPETFYNLLVSSADKLVIDKNKMK